MAFTDYNTTVGTIVTIIVILLALITVVLSLRAKTWHRFALKHKIENQVSTPINEQIAIGSRGVAISRLSPIGKVEINGKIYEAKLITGYADPGSEVEVCDYQDLDIVVKIIKK